MVVCDTHVLIYDALTPSRLSQRALLRLGTAAIAGELACSDMSLWEASLLVYKGRVRIDTPVVAFLRRLVDLRSFTVLPITAEIAALAYSAAFTHGDPADRIIAATAMVHGAPLITEDRSLHRVEGLTALW